MRTLALAFVAMMVGLAGCSDDSGGGGGGTTTTTPETSTTPETTPTNTTTPTGTPTSTTPTPEPDAPPEPAVVHETTHTYPTVTAGDDAERTETFDVPEGYTTLLLNVTYTPASSAGPLGAGVANEARVAVRDAADAEASQACVVDGAVEEPTTCAVEVPVTEAGTWTVVFTGSGSVTADVSIVAM